MGVSVIVPIYNGEKTIKKCVESILAQDSKDIEVVLVDDGSVDNSSAICDDYSESYENITVFHQENKGLAKARLEGCKKAKNEKIAFVDCDDYIEPFIIKKLEESMIVDESHLVCSHIIFESSDKCVKSNSYSELGRKKIDDVLNRLIDSELGNEIGIEMTMCGKLFQKDLLIEALDEIAGCKSYGEDLEELLRYISKIDNITFVNEWGYHYVKYDNSMSNNVDLSYFNKIKKIYDVFESLSDSIEKNKQIINQANLFIRFLLMETTSSIFPKIELGYISYVPPYEIIPKGSKLVIYGAGKVGKSMAKCLKASEFAEIVLWIDNNCSESIYGIEVEEPKEICKCVYDYVLIAVSVEDYVNEIREQLKQLGVPEGKILWKKPYNG